MTPDIQELRRLAEEYAATEHGKRAGLYAQYMRAASPSTILALIEENERLRDAASGLERNVGALSIAEIEVRQAISNTNWEVIQNWREKVRAALKETTGG